MVALGGGLLLMSELTLYGEPDIAQEEVEGLTSAQLAMTLAISAVLFGMLPSHRDATCERETKTLTKHVRLTKPDRMTKKSFLC